MRRLLILLAAALVLAACGGLEDAPPIAPTDEEPPPVDASEGVVEAGTEDGQAAAELVADPEETSPDGEVILRIENRGEVDINYGRPITVERWDGDEWVETDESRESVWTMELLHLPAGESGVDQPWPFIEGHEPEPGWYRFTKQIYVEGESGESTELIVRARVRVAG
jgi:hypothetical protein